jgi:hypothetical protein
VNTRVRVDFRSDPPGATVHHAGSVSAICITPCSHTIDTTDGGDRSARTFVLERDGFVEHEEDVAIDEGSTVEVNVMLVAAPEPGTPLATKPTRTRGKSGGRSRGKPPAQPGPTEPVTPPAGSDKIDPTDTMDPFEQKP